MKRPSIIRTALLLGSASAALWQAPRIIALVDQVRTQGGLSGLNPAAALGAPGDKSPGGADMSLDEIRSLINGATPIGKAPAKKPPGEVVIFSPQGARLTEKERQRLRRQAENQRPDLIPPVGAGPDGIGRVSLPPLVRPATLPSVPTPKPSETDRAPSSPPGTRPPDADASESAPPKPEGASSDPLASATGPDTSTLTETSVESAAESSDPLAGYGDGPPIGPVGLHDELRELLVEIAPPAPPSVLIASRGRGHAWRATGLPPGTRPTFIIGPPRAASRSATDASP